MKCKIISKKLLLCRKMENRKVIKSYKIMITIQLNNQKQ